MEIQGLIEAADRASVLTRQLLAFGRRQILQLETVDLGDSVSVMEPMLRRLIGEDIVIATDLATDLPPVRADRTQLQQVLLNLAVNARDAMPGGGTLTIRTRVATPDVAEGAVRAAGVFVMLEVVDTGRGIGANRAP